jgi:alpha-ketoglutarate-dependent taurine dioxygenase
MVTYGNGKEIEAGYLETCKRILEEAKVTFKWEKGDVLLIDNRLVQHSRNTFIPPRRILAALFQ